MDKYNISYIIISSFYNPKDFERILSTPYLPKSDFKFSQIENYFFRIKNYKNIWVLRGTDFSELEPNKNLKNIFPLIQGSKPIRTEHIRMYQRFLLNLSMQTVHKLIYDY